MSNLHFFLTGLLTECQLEIFMPLLYPLLIGWIIEAKLLSELLERTSTFCSITTENLLTMMK